MRLSTAADEILQSRNQQIAIIRSQGPGTNDIVMRTTTCHWTEDIGPSVRMSDSQSVSRLKRPEAAFKYPLMSAQVSWRVRANQPADVM